MLNAVETPWLHHPEMRDAMSEDVRGLIAAAVAGAGDGADALRRAGVVVELEGYTVDLSIDPSDPGAAATVRVSFRSGPRGDAPSDV